MKLIINTYKIEIKVNYINKINRNKIIKKSSNKKKIKKSLNPKF